MKKIVFAAITTTAIIAAHGPAMSQKNDLVFNVDSYVNSLLPKTSAMHFEDARANHVNIKAVRNFAKTFKTINNNKWVACEDGGFVSSFDVNGINTAVGYDRKGNHVYTIRSYGEDKMSFDIRDMVKRQYYDASIALVKEVETDNGLVIYVHMQDKDSWKIVRIADGEMLLVEKLNKR